MAQAGPSPSRTAGRSESAIQPGSSVDVRSRFDGAWCGGFAIAEVVIFVEGEDASPRYRLRRQSDGAVLPKLFTPHEVVPARAKRVG
jgi:hypothetical protein